MIAKRDYLITPDPAHGVQPWARVSAINALDALDQYALGEGYSNYEDIGGRLKDWIGVDQYGLWGIFTNATIWAVPALPVSPPAEISRLEHEGVSVAVTRNAITGQLIVVINTEAVDDRDQDSEGYAFIQVTLNDGAIHDYENEELECDGHEHDPGNPAQISGETYYCDGSCRRRT